MRGGANFGRSRFWRRLEACGTWCAAVLLAALFLGGGLSANAADGDFVWAGGMSGTGNDQGTSVALDSSGNVYTTGHFFGTVDFDPGAGTSNLTAAGFSTSDIFVSKLDSSGAFVWAKALGGTSDDSGRASRWTVPATCTPQAISTARWTSTQARAQAT